MSTDRRSFIKSFGVTLSSLVISGSLTGCKTKKTQINERYEKEILLVSEWSSLRRCWLDLYTLQEDIRNAYRIAKQEKRPDFFNVEENVKKERAARHQNALKVLVTSNHLDEAVAGHIQAAFEEGLYHIARSMATCYLGPGFDYNVRRSLLRQADVLTDISGDLDHHTIKRARAAIAQDMAYFEETKDENFNYKLLRESYEKGKLKASPEALEAARLLTQLLLGETLD